MSRPNDDENNKMGWKKYKTQTTKGLTLIIYVFMKLSQSGQKVTYNMSPTMYKWFVRSLSIVGLMARNVKDGEH